MNRGTKVNTKARYLTTGMALLLIGLSLTTAVTLTAPHSARANPGVLYAAPGGATSGNCDSWTNACTLQYALSRAESGDEIWVKAGVHYPGVAWQRTATFTLKNGVALYGGFAGTENSRDERNWQANLTILSGDIDHNDTDNNHNGIIEPANGDAIVGANAYHVVTGSGTDNTAVLDGFIITAGQANGSYPHYYGGGMYNSSGSPTLTNVTFSGNTATADGGGIYEPSSNPTLTNVTFSGNSAGSTGGGIYNCYSNPTLTNVTFSGNTAGNGGGMLNDSSSPTLTYVTFSGNSASSKGGGMFNYSSGPTLTHVTFSGNSATGYGGGMYNNENCAPRLTDVSFEENNAPYGGGMYNNSYSNPTLTDVTFSSNSATYNGGGMYNSQSSPTLVNVTFSGNFATYGSGGGMYNVYSSSPNLTQVTFSSNSAVGTSSSSGGGMYNDYSSPTLTNVAFSGNSARSGGGMYNYNSSPALTHVTFSSNSASGNATSSGGGMLNYDYSSPTLTDVAFSGNTATADGGGMSNVQNSRPTLVNVTFRGNTATYGGGMSNYSSSRPAALTNVTFSGNTATDYGGGMYNSGSSPALTNVSFSGNSAGSGGGMYNYSNSPTLANVILWGDSASGGPEIYNVASTPTIFYSDIQGCGGSGSGWNPACGADGDGNIDADPRFVDADGPDDTFGTADDNLRLQLTSPAIDAGNNDFVPTGVTTDLDGNPRFVDIPTVPDTGSGTPPIVDMGAYEAQVVDVALGKAVTPSTAAPGQAVTFTLTLSNTGSIPATGIVVTDTLPAILTELSFTSTLAVTDTGHVPPYVWTVQDLAAGRGGVITVSGVLSLPLAAGAYINTAVIAATGDLLAGNNTAAVTFTVPNVAPAFTSAPLVTATQDVPYSYTAAAVDDNGDALTITAPTLPTWLTLTDHGDGTASLSGTPTNAEVGEHPVVLQVADSGGLTATQAFTITVANVNDAPAFTSTPPLTATQDIPYTYTITTTDPDLAYGDALTVTAPTLPAWLTLQDHGDGTATLSGTPTEVSEYPVVLRVTDRAGAFTEQSFTITVPKRYIFLPLVLRGAP
jgi:uncharacterized repeat protein (TIGR01451 family)